MKGSLMICPSCSSAADEGRLGEVEHMAEGCKGDCDCAHSSISVLKIQMPDVVATEDK